ncbi:Asp/Glu/hydantoin racemase [Aquabacterium humicola]|uniref:Asp/Glu/hydantoin racemase n=1 Tax=Aquabacterium humicola TaxID=3237377 RepID=UPI002543ECA7|nr:Asp/Glu/hydantoin racemase [Rubrivivax pictus]
MRPSLVFLHTAPVHVPTFTALAAELAPGCDAHHVVDETLLAEARHAGTGDAALIARVQAAMRAAAQAHGAGAVVCTCSTIGGLAERTPTDGRFITARIDRAMADRAVASGPRILVVAALDSTLAPTAALLQESADVAGRAITPRCVLAEGAWACFEAGDIARYHERIAACVRTERGDADVVVLAQASMAPAADRLADLGIDVLASPRLGVQAIAERLGAGPPDRPR